MTANREDQVSNTDEAYAYILDCTLATVSHLTSLKRPSKHELKRQISIAQKAIDWAHRYDVDISGTRADDVHKFGTVQKWADDMKVRWENLTS
tara:strand:- start:25 stop:303 length:279 start_codon:yes stop_codon:yes gene_type:complete